MILAFALGSGLAFIPAVGVPLRFALSGQPALLSYGAAFLLGAIVGALAHRSTREF